MEKDIKLTEITDNSEKTQIFNGDFAQLMIAVADMVDLNVCEVIVKKK